MSCANEFDIHQILDKRLEEIAESLGYREQPPESEEYKELLKEWRAYLGLIGVKIADNWRLPAQEDGHIVISDPLYTSGEWIVIPAEVAEKMMIVGLP